MSEPADQYTFAIQSLNFAEGDPEDRKKPRTISGVAYSGGLIPHPFWFGGVVFDLSSTKAKNKLPLLLDHDPARRAGFTKKVEVTDKITVQGSMLSNEDAKGIVSDADEGFPWQMSVRITPKNSMELSEGASEMVNGRKVKGPATIFRNSVISEISFTPIGVDANTSAQMLSKENPNQHKPGGPKMAKNDEPKTELEIAQAKVLELTAKVSEETKRADEAEKALLTFADDQRSLLISDLEKKAGRTFSDDEKKMLTGLDSPAFEFMSKSVMFGAETKNPSSGSALPESFFNDTGEQAANNHDHGRVNQLIESAKRRAGGQ